MSRASRAVAFLQEQYCRVLWRMRLKAWFAVEPVQALMRKIPWPVAAESRRVRNYRSRNCWHVDTLEPRVMLSGSASAYPTHASTTSVTETTTIKWAPEEQSKEWTKTTEIVGDSQSNSSHAFFDSRNLQHGWDPGDWVEQYLSENTRFVVTDWAHDATTMDNGQSVVTKQDSGKLETEQGDRRWDYIDYYSESSGAGDISRGNFFSDYWEEEHLDYKLDVKNTFSGDVIKQEIVDFHEGGWYDIKGWYEYYGEFYCDYSLWNFPPTPLEDQAASGCYIWMPVASPMDAQLVKDFHNAISQHASLAALVGVYPPPAPPSAPAAPPAPAPAPSAPKPNGYVNTGGLWDSVVYIGYFFAELPSAFMLSSKAVEADLANIVTGGQVDWIRDASQSAWDELNLQGTWTQTLSQTATKIVGGVGAIIFGTALSAVDMAQGIAGQNFMTGETLTGTERLTSIGSGILGFVPGSRLAKQANGATKANAVSNAKKLTGQQHHAISKKVHRELQQHKNLSGVYKARDPRFVTRAKDSISHRGYQKWHRDLDNEVVNWIKDNKEATPAQFESFLSRRYNRLDLLDRFPNGL